MKDKKVKNAKQGGEKLKIQKSTKCDFFNEIGLEDS
jgi:hypothetical protein